MEQIHRILAGLLMQGNLAHLVKTDVGVNDQPLVFNPDHTSLWADFDALSFVAGVRCDPVQIELWKVMHEDFNEYCLATTSYYSLD